MSRSQTTPASGPGSGVCPRLCPSPSGTSHGFRTAPLRIRAAQARVSRQLNTCNPRVRTPISVCPLQSRLRIYVSRARPTRAALPPRAARPDGIACPPQLRRSVAPAKCPVRCWKGFNLLSATLAPVPPKGSDARPHHPMQPRAFASLAHNPRVTVQLPQVIKDTLLRVHTSYISRNIYKTMPNTAQPAAPLRLSTPPPCLFSAGHWPRTPCSPPPPSPPPSAPVLSAGTLSAHPA